MSLPLQGKTALIFGVASQESIAWAIARKLASQGADIILGYQFRFHSRLKDFVPSEPKVVRFDRCDVTKDAELTAFFEKMDRKVDMVVHSIAFAPGEAFQGKVSETRDEDFQTALTVSAHSLAKLLNACRPHLSESASAVALTYLGGQRVCANYKVMGVAKAALEAYVRELAYEMGPSGVRVNAISAGPIRTLAAGGIPGFELMLDYHKSVAPLRRNVTQEDVAEAAAFLLSDASRGVTGQTVMVDGGYSIVGVPPLG